MPRAALRVALLDWCFQFEKSTMTLLASDFTGMGTFVLVGLCVVLMAMVSYFGSVRGHWSGPVLASPLLLGVLAFIGMGLWEAPEPLGVVAMLIPLSPLLILSGGSIAVWMIRRGAA
jgi:hypothetical protein